MSEPFTYSDLLECIRNLFGNRTLASIDLILYSFSRDDALRIPITNNEDLRKVITIAQTNESNKLSFFLTRKNNSTASGTISIKNNDSSRSISDDAQFAELNDADLDSPPPGTISTLKRCTTTNTSSKSMTSKDGGFFIPELVSFVRVKTRLFLNICVIE